jgi:hypothetical protein
MHNVASITGSCRYFLIRILLLLSRDPILSLYKNICPSSFLVSFVSLTDYDFARSHQVEYTFPGRHAVVYRAVR